MFDVKRSIMKKKGFVKMICLLPLLVAAILISCESETDTQMQTDNPELMRFWQTSIADDFMDAFRICVSDMDIDNMQIFPCPNDVNVLYIPVKRKSKDIGRLCVFSKSNGKMYNALYEDWTDLTTDGGDMKIYSVKRQYIATWKIEKDVSGKYSFKISDVVSTEGNFNSIKTRSEIDFPKPGDIDCTAKCYKAAKDACDSDYNCKYLCDLLDVFFCSATISIAASCQVYCW